MTVAFVGRSGDDAADIQYLAVGVPDRGGDFAERSHAEPRPRGRGLPSRDLVRCRAVPAVAADDSRPVKHHTRFATVASFASVVTSMAGAELLRIDPGPDAPYEIQEADRGPDRAMWSNSGKASSIFGRRSVVVVDHVTIRGQGIDRTILNFADQHVGSQGLTATGDAFVLEDLAIEDTAGNAVKVLGSDGVVFRRVRTEWTNGPDENNGAYGLYPVQCGTC